MRRLKTGVECREDQFLSESTYKYSRDPGSTASGRWGCDFYGKALDQELWHWVWGEKNCWIILWTPIQKLPLIHLYIAEDKMENTNISFCSENNQCGHFLWCLLCLTLQPAERHRTGWEHSEEVEKREKGGGKKLSQNVIRLLNTKHRSLPLKWGP